jgi:hypothetical protein
MNCQYVSDAKVIKAKAPDVFEKVKDGRRAKRKPWRGTFLTRAVGVVRDGTGSSIGRAGPAPEYEKGPGVKKVASEAQALAKLKRQATDLHEPVRGGQVTTQATVAA